jgi:ATP-dependent protease ClpP protease subunit
MTHRNEDQHGMEPQQGVSVVHRHIYFYCDVMPDTIQELVANFKNLEIEGLVQGAIYGIDPLPIHLHIFSVGGDMHSGFLAADMIRSSKVPVITYVEGLCASAATLMSCSGNKRYAGKSAMMLVHQLSATIEGKHDDVKDHVANADKMSDRAFAIYSLVVDPKNHQRLQELLRREVLLSAQESLELGLVDEIL